MVLRLRRRKATPAAQSSRETGVVMTWTIRQLADDYGLTLRTLRHYEDLGLLHPVRVGTERQYHQRDRIRLELILRGRRVGFRLDESRHGRAPWRARVWRYV